MIDFNKRTGVGSIGVIRTNSFTCSISTLPGLLRGTIAVFRANAAGEIVKWPPVGKAYLAWGMTREQRDEAHNYIMALLDGVGDTDEQPTPLAIAMESVFEVASARGVITKYITNPDADARA
jgi:hypothetical protein